MLRITDKAAQRLKGALSELDVSEDACFRLGMTEEGVKIVIDQERPGDTSVEYEEEALVVMDSVTADHLHGRELDYNETTGQLVFT